MKLCFHDFFCIFSCVLTEECLYFCILLGIILEKTKDDDNVSVSASVSSTNLTTLALKDTKQLTDVNNCVTSTAPIIHFLQLGRLIPKLFAVFLPYQVLVLCDIGLVAFGMIQDRDANAVNIGKIYTSVRSKEHRL